MTSTPFRSTLGQHTSAACPSSMMLLTLRFWGHCCKRGAPPRFLAGVRRHLRLSIDLFLEEIRFILTSCPSAFISEQQLQLSQQLRNAATCHLQLTSKKQHQQKTKQNKTNFKQSTSFGNSLLSMFSKSLTIEGFGNQNNSKRSAKIPRVNLACYILEVGLLSLLSRPIIQKLTLLIIDYERTK